MRSPFTTIEHRAPMLVALMITIPIMFGALTDSRWYWLALIAGIHLWQSGLVVWWPSWPAFHGPHTRH